MPPRPGFRMVKMMSTGMWKTEEKYQLWLQWCPLYELRYLWEAMNQSLLFCDLEYKQHVIGER